MKLGGETPISDCLAENQQGGDLADGRRRDGRGGDRAQRAKPGPSPAATPTCSSATCSAPPNGAPTSTEGIHAELIRRLSAAARYSPDNRPLSGAFLAAYRRGLRRWPGGRLSIPVPDCHPRSPC